MTALTQALMELRAQRDRYAAAVDALERIAAERPADTLSPDPYVAAEPIAHAEDRPARRYKLSAETRRRMSLAQQARHAKRKGRR